MRTVFVVLFAFALAAGNGETLPYYTLAGPLEKNAESFERLSKKPVMEAQSAGMRQFVEKIRVTLAEGSRIARLPKPENSLLAAYLSELRELERSRQSIEALYRKSLLRAIESDDKNSFEQLVSIPLEPLNHPRVRSEAIAFYDRNYPKKSLPFLEKLKEEEALENRSIQTALVQEQAYEEHLKILKRSEAAAVKKTAQIGSRNSVILSAESDGKGGYEFEAENLNPYTVTLNIDFASIQNLRPSGKIPFFIEIPGNSRKKVLGLSRVSPTEGVNYRAAYGWVRGSAFAVHDDNYRYGLPFSKGSNIVVSQGYHGGITHRGLSAYAIDFPVPVGTPIHAAREGIVVGAEGSHDRGGLSPDFRQFANYVIIEHSDGTMGNYYHLMRGGAAVRIGQKVAQGELIGYSGNTGYSSGPHLHFSISKVDPVTMRRPMNLPVKIQTREGIVTLPQKGDRYTVQ
ncbi:M23 family metallopeptidase [Sulfuricurvum sp. IAE1]|uniref:M23 family metallopeptidase n=1 Tax=Sulfuricurvum sp. IAE1 TaxID=2546102 RepID=UPI00104AC484|nr:M23 family metallopeptidase [Sulfuricurvum sp. IAE1]TDA63053.1 M23 family metallopeptidase [Sulfuricurvum sp. IAE1]